jgi:phosphoserine phosphatase
MAETLPSWRPGATRDAIVAFVEAVTTEGGPDFLPAPERIAVFDNDGTLWCEQPLQVQVLYAQSQLRDWVAADPSMKTRQPWKALLEHDFKALHDLGKEAVLGAIIRRMACVTIARATADALAWLESAGHPLLKRPMLSVVYQPQLELLDYLRAHGFKTFIVSGGGVDFMRAVAERIYGIPPEQVIGSSLATSLVEADGGLELMKQPHLVSFDDREVKVQNIGLHIGRRPILCVGNSDGDLAMMRYTLAGPGKRLALLTHHDDDAREHAYDRDFRLSPLVEALDKAADYGITVISVKDDWDRVFP